MGDVEENQWFDKVMDDIGSVIAKADETIQKTIERSKELMNDLLDDEPTQDFNGQSNNGKKHLSQVPLTTVKERPIQNSSMCLNEVKQKPNQHWAMRALKIPESLIQEQGEDDYHDNDNDDDDEDGLSLKWNVDYQLLMSDDDIESSSEDDDDGGVDEEDTTVSEISENIIKLGSSVKSYISSLYHHVHNEVSGSSLKWECDYELLNNDDPSSNSKEDDEEVKEYHSENEDDVSNKLQECVDVRQEENADNREFGEVQTLLQESDWVYVTID